MPVYIYIWIHVCLYPWQVWICFTHSNRYVIKISSLQCVRYWLATLFPFGLYWYYSKTKFLFLWKVLLHSTILNVSSFKLSSVLLSQVLTQATNKHLKVAFKIVFFMGNRARISRKKTVMPTYFCILVLPKWDIWIAQSTLTF